MHTKGCIIVLLLALSCCQNPSASQEANRKQPGPVVNPAGTTIGERFAPPGGYSRTPTGSFGTYLRALPLHQHGYAVHLYNGAEKTGRDVHAAVLRTDVGSKDLQQCADAVIRLRAEYLYQSGNFDSISFNFTNGFPAAFSKWEKGYKIDVRGNDVSWVRSGDADGAYGSFRRYLDIVFMYAGTLSLSRQLQQVPFHEMQPGDVLIQGGSPGHAVIVVDMVQNDKGNKMFMLAQSYMPAQEIHVLHNFNNKAISPWYDMADIETIVKTPEWEFTTSDLKRFRE